MAIVAICFVVSLIANIWLVLKIRRVSWFYAVASFLFFPAAVFFMFAHWGDEEHDVRLPFFLTLIAMLIAMYQVGELVQEAQLLGETDEVSLQDLGYIDPSQQQPDAQHLLAA